jgi:hypothetical protein
VTLVARPSEQLPRRVTGLRINWFAAIVTLLFEFGLGIGVNLFAKLPESDAGKGILPASLCSRSSWPGSVVLDSSVPWPTEPP